MDSTASELMVLKPTMVFLSFLASQLPEKQLPSIQVLNTDNTAYVIPKHSSEEATLAEIEKNFTFMFRHEICRWLGKDARNDIETSFLDFLCCFKFEMHSHLILMEPTLKAGKQVLNIKPRSMLLNWVKSEVLEEEEALATVMDHITLTQLAENSTVIIKNFAKLNKIKPFLEEYYNPIFTTAMSRMSGNSTHWPVVNSLKKFSQYFEIQIHTQLIHLPY